MTDQATPVYDSVRLKSGMYEIRTFHEKTVRIIQLKNKKWVVVTNAGGRWIYNQAYQFDKKTDAARVGEQVLAELIKNEAPVNTGSIDQNGNLSKQEAMELLGFEKGAKPTKEEINRRFKLLALKLHPDNGTGSNAIMALLNRAMEVLK